MKILNLLASKRRMKKHVRGVFIKKKKKQHVSVSKEG
jgi:hypothetical protein